MERKKTIIATVLGFIMTGLSFIALIHSIGTELWQEVSATLAFTGFLTMSIMLTVQLKKPKQ